MCDDVRGTPRAVPALASAGVDAAAMQQIIATLGTAMAQTGPEQDLIVLFEREVQRLLRMRAVRLREIPARYQVRLVSVRKFSQGELPSAGDRPIRAWPSSVSANSFSSRARLSASSARSRPRPVKVSGAHSTTQVLRSGPKP